LSSRKTASLENLGNNGRCSRGISVAASSSSPVSTDSGSSSLELANHYSIGTRPSRLQRQSHPKHREATVSAARLGRALRGGRLYDTDEERL